MDKLQKTSSHLSTPLQSKEIEIAKSLFFVNILTPFRVDDSVLELWSQTINRLLPQLEIRELQALMDCFMKHEIEYETRLGVQNIFIGLAYKYSSKYKENKMVY